MHRFVNDLGRPVGAYLMGRRMYERTLKTTSSARTRIERDFDPQAVRELKAAADADLTVGGPELAAQALAAWLVDACQLFLTPVVVGGGNRAFPDGLRLDLELVDERRFGNGVIYACYRIPSPNVAPPGEGRR